MPKLLRNQFLNPIHTGAEVIRSLRKIVCQCALTILNPFTQTRKRLTKAKTIVWFSARCLDDGRYYRDLSQPPGSGRPYLL